MKLPLKLTLIFTLFATCSFAQSTLPPWKTLPEPPPMPKADRSGLAPVNNINLYYAVYNEHGKDPVILLHGGFTSSDEWGFEVPLLIKTHKVIAVDNRGHGRSTLGSVPFTYDLMSSDVLLLMDYLNVKKASIVGWSDGGIIGMILAIKHPERIHKLFTFGSNYNLAGYKDEPSDTSLAKIFMNRAGENYRKIAPAPGNFAQLKAALGKMYSNEPDLNPADLKTIKAQTVIAGGEYEQFIKSEHFKELANLIPNAKLVIIPNVAHGGPLQDPAAFHKAVTSLLGDTK